MAQRDDEANTVGQFLGSAPQQESTRQWIAQLPGGQTLLDRGDAADRAFSRGQYVRGLGEILGGGIAVPYRAGEALVGGTLRSLGELMTGVVGDDNASGPPSAPRPQAALAQAAAPAQPQPGVAADRTATAQAGLPPLPPALQQQIEQMRTEAPRMPSVALEAPRQLTPNQYMGGRYNRETGTYEPMDLGGARELMPKGTVPSTREERTPVTITAAGRTYLDPRYVQQQEQLWFQTGGRRGSLTPQAAMEVMRAVGRPKQLTPLEQGQADVIGMQRKAVEQAGAAYRNAPNNPETLKALQKAQSDMQQLIKDLTIKKDLFGNPATSGTN